MRERLQKLHQEKGEPWKYLLRVNLRAGPVALTKGALSNFALGLYHRLSPAPVGIILQLNGIVCHDATCPRPPTAICAGVQCAGCGSGKGGP